MGIFTTSNLLLIFILRKTLLSFPSVSVSQLTDQVRYWLKHNRNTCSFPPEKSPAALHHTLQGCQGSRASEGWPAQSYPPASQAALPHLTPQLWPCFGLTVGLYLLSHAALSPNHLYTDTSTVNSTGCRFRKGYNSLHLLKGSVSRRRVGWG